MSTSTDRQSYRELVAVVATAAKAKLPLAVNGRIESAAKLVLWQDVEPQDDGSILVGSASDPGKQYRLEGTSCTCQDFTRGQAPDGWCQHRIAAGIHKRAQQLMAAQGEPEPLEEEMLEPYPDNDWPPDEALAPAPQPGTDRPSAASTSLPEAPVSITLKASFDGQEVLVTLRGVDFASVKTQVEAAAAWLKAHAPAQAPQLGPQPASQPGSQEKRYCPLHGTEMQLNHKEGRSWWSHRTADGWCKGK